ncbi:YbaB/EbfC family nucleoid-associated protein [Lentzea sp. NPDC003310]|uniref:YbaB/EbfC family nucleoid-associated protein n=1 Tax=Lentzea sp. NPDC003310 TaxID=3154447 RepID=UPI0033BD3D7F
MPLEHIELANLNIPDDLQTRARYAELTRPGGVELRPAETYEACDPGGLITVTVNKSQLVTNVRIRPRWYEHLRPEAFPAALYNTYITAVQRALAVEFAQPPQGQESTGSTPAPGESSVDSAELSLEEFLARNKSRLDAVDAEYDAIRRRERAPQVDTTEIRSPLGYLMMQVRDGGPIALHGNPQALDNPSDTVLAEDILHLFARAGFGVGPGERPSPVARTERPRGDGDDADDEYFDGFKVLGKGDGSG